MADLKFSEAYAQRGVGFALDGTEVLGAGSGSNTSGNGNAEVGMTLQEIADFAAGGVRNSIYAGTKDYGTIAIQESIPSGAREVDVTNNSAPSLYVGVYETADEAVSHGVGNGTLVSQGQTVTVQFDDTRNFFAYVATNPGTMDTQWR